MTDNTTPSEELLRAPLVQYLGTLRAMSPELHPFVGDDELQPVVEPLVAYSHAVADLVVSFAAAKSYGASEALGVIEATVEVLRNRYDRAPIEWRADLDSAVDAIARVLQEEAPKVLEAKEAARLMAAQPDGGAA